VFTIVIVYVLCLYVFSVSLVCCHYWLELHGAAVQLFVDESCQCVIK